MEFILANLIVEKGPYNQVDIIGLSHCTYNGIDVI